VRLDEGKGLHVCVFDFHGSVHQSSNQRKHGYKAQDVGGPTQDFPLGVFGFNAEQGRLQKLCILAYVVPCGRGVVATDPQP
jgi:hypothetical protein